jgi:hypothetical protein
MKGVNIPAQQDLVDLLRKSEKFLAWKPSRPSYVPGAPVKPQNPAVSVEEKHFTPDELAELWACSPQTIRNLFDNEPGVLRIPSQRPGKRARKYTSIKIPESVAERIHKRLSAVPA